MNTSQKYTSSHQAGFSMVEVLVAMIILLVGLLGLAGLMIQSQRSEVESYQRVQALVLLQDMAGRVNANRNVASCYAFTTTTAGTPSLGASASAILPTCTLVGTAQQQSQFNTDISAWNNLLQGTTETSAGNIGAMVGARGCISYGGTGTELTNKNSVLLSGSGIYTVAVAWQGLGDTYAPTGTTPAMKCGLNQYGATNTKRRIVSLTFRIGAVNNLL